MFTLPVVLPLDLRCPLNTVLGQAGCVGDRANWVSGPRREEFQGAFKARGHSGDDHTSLALESCVFATAL